jgi:hypothetical protein
MYSRLDLTQLLYIKSQKEDMFAVFIMSFLNFFLFIDTYISVLTIIYTDLFILFTDARYVICSICIYYNMQYEKAVTHYFRLCVKAAHLQMSQKYFF